jgi:hypothetical protein
MRQLVKELNGRYQTAVHNQKVLVAEEVLCSIKDLGGRFLKKQAEKYWVEVSHSVAVEKISRSFRTMKRKGKSAARPSANNSDSREQAPRILHAPTPRHLAVTEQQPSFLANTFNTLPLLQYPSYNLVYQNAPRARPSCYDSLLALQERTVGLLMVPHMQASRNGAPSIPMTMAKSTFVLARELSNEIDSLLHKKRVDEAILARLMQYSAAKP